jgi:transcription elongation factor GreA
VRRGTGGTGARVGPPDGAHAPTPTSWSSALPASVTALSAPARAAVSARLDDLLAQRVAVFAESTSTGGSGDAADRAGNVEAIIRLEELDARIAALREQLSAPEVSAGAETTDTVQVGSRVTIRFAEDEAPEPFLVGLLEQAGGSVEVITPASPLGRALLGARPGDSVVYRAASGAPLTATLVEVAG